MSDAETIETIRPYVAPIRVSIMEESELDSHSEFVFIQSFFPVAGVIMHPDDKGEIYINIKIEPMESKNFFSNYYNKKISGFYIEAFHRYAGKKEMSRIIVLSPWSHLKKIFYDDFMERISCILKIPNDRLKVEFDNLVTEYSSVN